MGFMGETAVRTVLGLSICALLSIAGCGGSRDREVTVRSPDEGETSVDRNDGGDIDIQPVAPEFIEEPPEPASETIGRLVPEPEIRPLNTDPISIQPLAPKTEIGPLDAGPSSIRPVVPEAGIRPLNTDPSSVRPLVPEAEIRPLTTDPRSVRSRVPEAGIRPLDAGPTSVRPDEPKTLYQPLEAARDPIEPSSVTRQPIAMHRVDPETGASLVQVFYATDRNPIVDESDRIGMDVFLLPAIGGVVTLLFGLAMIFRSRRIVMGLLMLVSLLVTGGLWHSANLRYQKQKRLVDFGDRVYGSDRHLAGTKAALEVGICEVSIPPDHRIGKVESPSIMRLEFREDAKKHVVLQHVVREEEEAFYEKLRSCVGQSARKQAFVFVHGYNVGFDGAVKRTAQIAHDLKFDGAPICYSWPSKGELTDYTRDESNVTWTVTHFEDFLERVVQDSGATSVHLIAHSMGNRALVQALERMALSQTTQEPVFGQVIMAAPDVDASEFHNRYAPSVTRLARQVTLYASTNDQALVASTKVHGHTRAGLSGDALVVVPGVDTVDVSPIDTGLIGHSYYGNNPKMIQDLQAIVELGKPVADREWLERIARSPTIAYWAFRR